MILYLYIRIRIQFWKVGRRKFFAVRESNLRPSQPRKNKNTVSLDSDSSDNMFMPFPKRSNCKQPSESVQLLTEMQGIRKEIGQLFEVNKQLPISQSMTVPPVIYVRCCKSLIGCQWCTDQWETGLMQQACPKCHAEWAYAEMCVFKGINDFLLAIRPLVQLDMGMSSAGDEEDN